MRLLIALLAVLFPASALAAEITIGTFNAEFLTRPKVHAKFGFDLNLTKPADIAMWDAPGFRDQKFAEGAAAVASVVAGINADIIVMTEVGDEGDVQELKDAIAARGVTYPHMAVCACTDTFTQQHVAVLSKIPLTDVVKAIPGREGYFREADDDSDGKTMTQLAAEAGVVRSYFTRILRLSFLAPEIVKAILRDRHPLELTKRLANELRLPIAWDEQRALLGSS